jgi:hypothetical protein
MRHDSYMLDYSNSVTFNAGTSFILRLGLSSKHHQCATLTLTAHKSAISSSFGCELGM